MEIQTKHINQAWKIANSLFKTRDGQPVDMTYAQCILFAQIFWQLNPRVHVMTYTQYGKSETIAMAVLARSVFIAEPYAILGPTKEKAQIIMDYIIQHIFDNAETQRAFMLDPGDNTEYIRRYRNKRKLTFEVKKPNIRRAQKGQYSEIYVQSAAEALGFGAKNVIEDESGLIADEDHTLVLRMLGGFKENFLCKVGNPFNRNHFMKSFKDPAYTKLVITGEDGVEEGRLSPEFLEEMRKGIPPQQFAVLYDCKFPEAESIDREGYVPLITEKELENFYMPVKLFGELRMGVDVAGEGGNYTTITVRGENGAHLKFKKHTADTMTIITRVQEVGKLYNIPIDDQHVFVDKGGIGIALCDRMNEMFPGNSFGINFGGKPEASDGWEQFINRRAQMYWRAAQWLRKGGRLDPKEAYAGLANIRYKIQSDKKIKLRSKQEMIQEDGGVSPDEEDSLALTFATEYKPKQKSYQQGEYQPTTSYGI